GSADPDSRRGPFTGSRDLRGRQLHLAERPSRQFRAWTSHSRRECGGLVAQRTEADVQGCGSRQVLPGCRRKGTIRLSAFLAKEESIGRLQEKRKGQAMSLPFPFRLEQELQSELDVSGTLRPRNLSGERTFRRWFEGASRRAALEGQNAMIKRIDCLQAELQSLVLSDQEFLVNSQ